jgi:hypothetical protein
MGISNSVIMSRVADAEHPACGSHKATDAEYLACGLSEDADLALRGRTAAEVRAWVAMYTEHSIAKVSVEDAIVMFMAAELQVDIVILSLWLKRYMELSLANGDKFVDAVRCFVISTRGGDHEAIQAHH